MATKRKATPEYLKELLENLEILNLELEEAKKGLFQHTETAKIGEPAFEVWRKKCLELTDNLYMTIQETARVKVELNVSAL